MCINLSRELIFSSRLRAGKPQILHAATSGACARLKSLNAISCSCIHCETDDDPLWRGNRLLEGPFAGRGMTLYRRTYPTASGKGIRGHPHCHEIESLRSDQPGNSTVRMCCCNFVSFCETVTYIPPSRRRYASQLPIVAYRIEPISGGDFSVWVRRKSGPSMVAIIFGIALLITPAVFIYLGVAHPSHAGPRGSRGTPICLWPLLVCVLAVVVWHSVQAIIAEFRGLGGKEQWLFAHGQIAPPVDQLGYQLPPMAADFQGIRAGLNVTGGKWVVDFSDGGRNLYLGPFDSKALAQRCEAELRRLRPAWFSQQAGIAVLNGFIGETRINGYKSPPEPVVSFEPVVTDAGECRLQLRRDRRPRRWVYFIMFWLCGWLVGEIVAVWNLFHDLTAIFGTDLLGSPDIERKPIWKSE